MTDPLRIVLEGAQHAESQLKNNTQLLNDDISKRDEETRRAEALFRLFQEKRFVEDVKNGRICQPPIFYEEWNNSIGKIIQYVDGADNSAFPQMYNSYKRTLDARFEAHNKELANLLK